MIGASNYSVERTWGQSNPKATNNAAACANIAAVSPSTIITQYSWISLASCCTNQEQTPLLPRYYPSSSSVLYSRQWILGNSSVTLIVTLVSQYQNLDDFKKSNLWDSPICKELMEPVPILRSSGHPQGQSTLDLVIKLIANKSHSWQHKEPKQTHQWLSERTTKGAHPSDIWQPCPSRT